MEPTRLYYSLRRRPPSCAIQQGGASTSNRRRIVADRGRAPARPREAGFRRWGSSPIDRRCVAGSRSISFLEGSSLLAGPSRSEGLTGRALVLRDLRRGAGPTGRQGKSICLASSRLPKGPLGAPLGSMVYGGLPGLLMPSWGRRQSWSRRERWPARQEQLESPVVICWGAP